MSKQQLLQFIKTTTARLSLTYLAIIMTMSVSFSVILYNTSARELNRPRQRIVETFGPSLGEPRVDAFLADRAAEGQQRLIWNLVLLNLMVLTAGAYVSYLLARRTLEPIEAAMDAQTRFTADASHELRTPLAAIKAENEVALRKPHLTLTRAKELLQSNLEEAGKLKALSDGLLQLSQAERHHIDLQSVPIADIATEAINRVIKPAQAKGIVIEDTVTNVQVAGDKQLLVQAVVVLLDNAIKYSPVNSIIRMHAHQEGKHAVITVTDQGCGISATDQAHIFERFYRADQSRSKRQVSGYGLGLSIARKIVDQHSGTVNLSSMPGRGSTFTVRLPLSQL